MDEQADLPSDRNAAYYATVGADYFDVDGDGYVREDGTAIGLIFEGMTDDLDRMRAIRARLRAAVSDEATQPDTPADERLRWEQIRPGVICQMLGGYVVGPEYVAAPADPLAALRAMPEWQEIESYRVLVDEAEDVSSDAEDDALAALGCATRDLLDALAAASPHPTQGTGDAG